MSEKALQEGLQTDIQAMSEFASADVVINEVSLIDQPQEQGPYIIILNSDNFRWRQDTSTKNDHWDMLLMLVQPFVTDWKTTLDNFRDTRQALRDKLIGSTLSSGGLAGKTIDEIHPLSDAFAWPPDVDVPYHWIQPLVLINEEF